MTEPLAKAARRYHDAQKAVDGARGRLAAAQDAVRRTRAELHAAIAKAAEDGVRQVDIAAAVGMTREQVRRIARAAGVEPD